MGMRRRERGWGGERRDGEEWEDANIILAYLTVIHL